MLGNEILEMVEKAKEEIKKTYDYLWGNRGAFEMMNLKVFPASYYCHKDVFKDFPGIPKELVEETFDYWIEDEFDFFNDWLEKEFGMPWIGVSFYIGRTSSFYLHNRNIIYHRGKNAAEILKLYFGKVLVNLMEERYTNEPPIASYISERGEFLLDELEKDLKNEESGVSEDDILDDFAFLSEDLFKETKNLFDIPIQIFKKIDAFKENQVESFKEYLKYQYEEFLEEEKQENEEKRLTQLFSKECQEDIQKLFDEFLKKYPSEYLKSYTMKKPEIGINIRIL